MATAISARAQRAQQRAVKLAAARKAKATKAKAAKAKAAKAKAAKASPQKAAAAEAEARASIAAAAEAASGTLQDMAEAAPEPAPAEPEAASSPPQAEAAPEAEPAEPAAGAESQAEEAAGSTGQQAEAVALPDRGPEQHEAAAAAAAAAAAVDAAAAANPLPENLLPGPPPDLSDLMAMLDAPHAPTGGLTLDDEDLSRSLLTPLTQQQQLQRQQDDGFEVAEEGHVQTAAAAVQGFAPGTPAAAAADEELSRSATASPAADSYNATHPAAAAAAAGSLMAQDEASPARPAKRKQAAASPAEAGEEEGEAAAAAGQSSTEQAAAAAVEAAAAAATQAVRGAAKRKPSAPVRHGGARGIAQKAPRHKPTAFKGPRMEPPPETEEERKQRIARLREAKRLQRRQDMYLHSAERQVAAVVCGQEEYNEHRRRQQQEAEDERVREYNQGKPDDKKIKPRLVNPKPMLSDAQVRSLHKFWHDRLEAGAYERTLEVSGKPGTKGLDLEPFVRLVRELTEQAAAKLGSPNAGQHRFKGEAILRLKAAAEDHVVAWFGLLHSQALAAGRSTIEPMDVITALYAAEQAAADGRPRFALPDNRLQLLDTQYGAVAHDCLSDLKQIQSERKRRYNYHQRHAPPGQPRATCPEEWDGPDYRE